jgi:hypothetical protein
MRNLLRVIFWAPLVVGLLVLTAVIVNGQKTGPTGSAVSPTPLISDYKGIRLGMTSTQVRAKLGDPTLKADDQDYYIISPSESLQVAYDATHKVVTISIDFSGTAAPDYRNVIGASIDQMTDGSLYKLVRYEAQGFWVSYNRTAGTAPVVTITIQKIF